MRKQFIVPVSELVPTSCLVPDGILLNGLPEPRSDEAVDARRAALPALII